MRTLTTIVLLSAALAACTAPRYDVKTDQDPEADFASYRTFALPPRAKVDTPNVLDNSLVLKRIAALVSQHLEARGLTRVAMEDAPDLTLRLWVTAQEKTDISTIPSSPFWGPYPGPYGGPYPGAYPYNYGHWGPMYDDVIVRNYVEGTLVIDLLDVKSTELVWRAYVVGTVMRDREQAYAAMDEAIGRAIAELPVAAAKH